MNRKAVKKKPYSELQKIKHVGYVLYYSIYAIKGNCDVKQIELWTHEKKEKK